MSLATSGLSFQYNDQNTFRFPDMELGKGEHLLILGPSGKGKSTLLHLLAGLLTPSKGNISVDSINLSDLSARKLDRFRGKQIGIIFQRSYFVRSLTVKENLLLAQKLAGQPTDENRISMVLERMNVLDKWNSYPGDLSIGEQQRVSIGRAVINKPALILADEPTSALDDENAVKVASLLEQSAAEQEANLVIVTHDHRLKEQFQNVISL